MIQALEQFSHKRREPILFRKEANFFREERFATFVFLCFNGITWCEFILVAITFAISFANFSVFHLKNKVVSFHIENISILN